MIDPTVHPKGTAEQAETYMDLLEDLIDDGAVEPTLELQQAIGRVAHAANELWHKIAGIRSNEWKEKLS